MKIGFVTPWFGMNIPGGAEAELRGLLLHIKDKVQVEILTTCVEKFTSDWNVNYYKEGTYIEGGLVVKRFEVRKRDIKAFDAVNYKLMNNMLPLTDIEEELYVREMVNSPALYQYIRENQEEYDLFVFIPYMFGTTYYGMREVPEKAVLIPCLHNESYIHLRIFKEVFSKIAGMIFHAKPESDLAYDVYNLENVYTQILGEGVETELNGNAKRFREKYHIDDEFILYAGRKDSGKNVDTLIRYFGEYRKRNDASVKLVMIGGGDIDIPSQIRGDVIDLGFVDVQDKYDAYAAALFLCQPSHNESFSLVIMESWLSGRPVLVSDECEVTKNFAIESQGGLWFREYFDFEGCLNYYLENPQKAEQMGKNGREYVMSHFSWDVIVETYCTFFEHVAGLQE